MDTGAAIRQVDQIKAIRESIRAVTDDEDAIRDTLEGETDIAGLIRMLLLSVEDDQAMVDGCQSRIDELKERQDRFKHRIEAKRGLIHQAVALSGQRKIEMDIATVSLRAVPPKVIVTNESELPSSCFKTTVRVDLSTLGKMLKDGDSIPGAHLDNGGESITIRRK